MLVKDKSSAIAILRTVGATRGAIMRVFLIAGVSISAVGTLAGVALGLLIALNAEHIRAALNSAMHLNLFPAEIYYLSKLPSEVEPRDIVVIAGATLLISLVATLYPSWEAARLDPVEARRDGCGREARRGRGWRGRTPPPAPPALPPQTTPCPRGGARGAGAGTACPHRTHVRHVKEAPPS